MAQVTVAIPVYNGERFIGRAMESVLAQTYPDFILRVIDNASTDRTEQIVKSFKDKRIRYVRNKRNLGMLGNWNKCLMADTKYVALLFADDFYKPEFLEKCIKGFTGNMGIVASGFNDADNDGNVGTKYPFKKEGVFSAKEYYTYIYGNGDCPLPSATVLLTKAVKTAGGFDTKNLNWLVDGDLYLRICLKGYGVRHLPGCFSCRRAWSGNSLNKFAYSTAHFLDRYYMLRKYYRKDWITDNTLKSAYEGVWRMLLGSIFHNARRGSFRLAAEQLALLISEGDRPVHDNSVKYRISSAIKLGNYLIRLLPRKMAGG